MKFLLLLLFAAEAHAGLIWQFTFGPDETNELQRGTLLLQLGPGVVEGRPYDDLLHDVTHFALNIDGEHYAPNAESAGLTRQWTDIYGPGWDATKVDLPLADGRSFFVHLFSLNGVPQYNAAYIYDRGATSLRGIVTSWRVLGVPEPGTLALFAAGFLALVLVRRRDRDDS